MAVNEELWIEFRAKMDGFFDGIDKGKKAQRDFVAEAQKSVQQIDALYGTLGKGPDSYKAKMTAVSAEVKKAIASGITPQSEAVQKLASQYKNLKAELDLNTAAQQKNTAAAKQAAKEAAEAQKQIAIAAKEAKQASEQMMKSQKQSFTDMAAKAYLAYQAIKQLATLVNQGFEFNQLIENSQTAFTVMLGSAERASSMIADLTKLSMTTPIGLGEAAESTKQMLAFGFATNTMVDNLKMLGTVAGAINKPLDDLVYIYGTLRTQGQAYMRDIMQFAMRGIPIYEALGEVMGVPASQIKKLTEQGKIGFAEVEKAFKKMTGEGGIFAGMLEKRMQTLSGSLDIMKKQLTMTLGVMTQASSGPLRTFADAVTNALRGGGSAFSGIGNDLRTAFSSALGVIRNILPSIISGVSLIVSLVKDISSGPIGMLAGLFVNLLGVLVQVANFLRGPLGVALSVFLASKMWLELGKAIQFVIVQMRAMAVASITMATASQTTALGFTSMANSIRGMTLALTTFLASPAGLALLALAGITAGVTIAMQDIQAVEEAANKRKEQAQSLDPYARRTAIVDEMKATGASAHANYSASDNADFIQTIANKLRVDTMEAAKIAFEEGFIEPATYTKMQTDMQKIQESGKAWQKFLSDMAAGGQKYTDAVAAGKAFYEKQATDIYAALPGTVAPEKINNMPAMYGNSYTRGITSQGLFTEFDAKTLSKFTDKIKAIQDAAPSLGSKEASSRIETVAKEELDVLNQAIIDVIAHNKNTELGKDDQYVALVALLEQRKKEVEALIPEKEKKAPKKKEEQEYISWLAREWETKITETRLDDIELERDKSKQSAMEVYKKRSELAKGNIDLEIAARDEYYATIGNMDTNYNQEIAAEKMRVESEFQDYMAQGQAILSNDKMAMIQAEYNIAMRAEEAKMQAVKDTKDEERKRIEEMSALRIKNIEEVKRLAIEAEQASQFQQAGKPKEGASQRLYAAAQRGIELLATAAKEAASGMTALSESTAVLIKSFGDAVVGTIAKSSIGSTFLGQAIQVGADAANNAVNPVSVSAAQEAGMGAAYANEIGKETATEADKSAAAGNAIAQLFEEDFIGALLTVISNLEGVSEILDSAMTLVSGFVDAFGYELEFFVKIVLDTIKPMLAGIGEIIPFILNIATTLLVVLKPAIDIVSVALQAVGAALSWFNDYVIVPVANGLITMANGFIDGLNVLIKGLRDTFGVAVTLIPRIDKLKTSLEQAAEAAAKEAKQKEMELALASITDTIDYLNNKLKSLVDKQIETAQDMYEVGAITAKQYEALVAEANKNIPSDKNILSAALLAESIPAIKAMLETLGTEKTTIETALEKFKEDGITPVLNSLDIINNTLLHILATTGTEAEKKFANDALTSGTNGGTTSGGRTGSGADAAASIANSAAIAQAKAVYEMNRNWWINASDKNDKTHAREYLTAAENYAAALGHPGSQMVIDTKASINNWAAGHLYGWSLATGTANVPRDNIAQIHQGEGIIPEPFMDSIRRGDLYLGKNTGGNRESGTVIQVSVNVQGSVQSEDNLAITIANAIDRGRRRGIITV